MLAPVANPGGIQAISIEARRLQQLEAAGLRVPSVLARQHDALLLSDLGESTTSGCTLLERLQKARAQPPGVLLDIWKQGLQALADVHAAGQCLSQAFARNLICCPDGAIGFIDFEDDPGAQLSIERCQVRDWLSYLHSSAAYIDVAMPEASGALWSQALSGARPEVTKELQRAARRMGWLRHLPSGRRWGRDTQQLRAAARLLGHWHGN